MKSINIIKCKSYNNNLRKKKMKNLTCKVTTNFKRQISAKKYESEKIAFR